MRAICRASLILSLGASALAGDGWFVPGRVFIEELEPEACYRPDKNNWLVAVDPTTGEAWDVADRDDGLCNNNGMRFSPDGQFLRILNLGRNNVLALDQFGTTTLVYDTTDGLGGPFGRNGLDWDVGGFFFVANEYSFELLRFPPDGGTATVLADIDDGVSGGPVACAPNGDVYYGDRGVWRITPAGDAILFDTLGPNRFALSIAFDRVGNLFVAFNGAIYRYRGVDASTRQVIATGFYPLDGNLAIAISPDDSVVYAADANALYGVDAQTGDRWLIHDTPYPRIGGRGIAVYDPPRPGDVNCDRRVDNGDIDAFVLALTDPDAYAAQFSWCRRDLADVNGDTIIDAADIDPFVARLIGE